MSAPQELVQFDKKSEIVLSDGRFATVCKVKIGHVIASQDENPMHQAVKLISIAVKIDDKTPTIQEVLHLDVEDFIKIMHQLSL
jgi:hypothetical protein